MRSKLYKKVLLLSVLATGLFFMLGCFGTNSPKRMTSRTVKKDKSAQQMLSVGQEEDNGHGGHH